jgi:hypothetical protein
MKMYSSFFLHLLLNIHVFSEVERERNKMSLELLAKHLPDTAVELQ